MQIMLKKTVIKKDKNAARGGMGESEKGQKNVIIWMVRYTANMVCPLKIDVWSFHIPLYLKVSVKQEIIFK